MATSVKLSKEFILFYDGQAICRATDFDFEINKQTIDITTLCSAGWRELMVDGKEWRVNFNGLVTRQAASTVYSAAVTYAKDAVVRIVGQDYFFRSVVNGNIGNNPVTDDGSNWIKIKNDYDGLLQEIKESDAPVDVVMRSSSVGDKYETGKGFVTSLRKSGSVGDKVTYSGSIEGTVDLETFIIIE